MKISKQRNRQYNTQGDERKLSLYTTTLFLNLNLMLSINCKEAGDLNCSHTITGNTEQELFENAKKHAMETHGMTAQDFEEDAMKNEEKYRKLIKQT